MLASKQISLNSGASLQHEEFKVILDQHLTRVTELHEQLSMAEETLREWMRAGELQGIVVDEVLEQIA